MEKLISTWQKLGDGLDAALDKLTTYKLVFYSLLVYFGAALILDLTGYLKFGFFSMVASAGVLIIASRLANNLFSKLFKVPHNQESDYITALILALILTPASNPRSYGILAIAAIAAQLSKYVVSVAGRHLFNPAALGATISGLVLNYYPSWWVGNSRMAPLLIVGGLLILKKVRRFMMVGAFLLVALLYLWLNAPSGQVGHFIWIGLFASPLIFLATIMLTEPMTSPYKLSHSLCYAAVVAVLYSVIKLGIPPEEALLAGNLLIFGLAPGRSIMLSFVRQQKEAEGIYSYVFNPPHKLNFKPGQYMELTMTGSKFDSRGNRRYLTIASSPTQESLMFTIRMPEKASSFKQNLIKLRHGDRILASMLAGGFNLPKKPSEKLVFIAGGVGITPFHSMVQYLLDRSERRDIKLLYFVNEEAEIAYKKLFDEAKAIGLSSHYVVSQPSNRWQGLSGIIDQQLLAKTVPDYKERRFMISGPQGFVAAARTILTDMGVQHSQIVTDFFPGYN